MPEEMTTTTETATSSASVTSEAPPPTPEAPQQAITPALFDEPPDQTEPPQTTDTTEQPQTETTSEPEQLTAKDITLPEGTTYDEELGNSFLGLLNDTKLTRKELSQKLFDLYHSEQVKILEGLKAAEAERVKKFEADMTAEKAEWLKQCTADTEYGGQKWEASQAVIDRGCKEIATPEAVNLMQRYNLNTHPEIVRMFYRAGLMAGEDSSRIAGTGTGKPSNPAMAIFGESLKDYHKRRGDIN